MEPHGLEPVFGAASEAHAALATVAHLTGVQPNIQADSSPTANSFPFGAISEPSGPGQIQHIPGAQDSTCGMASDGAPPSGQLEVGRTNGTLDQLPVSEVASWRGQNELLPPARLVEVAHAALHGSGFRRRLQAGAHQPSHQDVQLLHNGLPPTVPEIERSLSAKRELICDSNCVANKALDVKRPRTNSSDEAQPHTGTVGTGSTPLHPLLVKGIVGFMRTVDQQGLVTSAVVPSKPADSVR
jgi:hypothetical protein